jgi:sugar lactone lactonase YvrE
VAINNPQNGGGRQMHKRILLVLVTGLLAYAVLARNANLVAAQGSDRYVINSEWAKLPAAMTWDASTSAIAADGKGNVVVLVRTAPFFRMFTRDGKFVRSWGEPDLFVEPHSIMFDRDGFIWTTDANGHVVYKFSADGKQLLMTLGKKGVAGDNTSKDLFNRPNAVAIAPNGDVLVSDGYVNSRVVRFAKDGKFIAIVGGVKGNQPGQLQLPHGVVLDSKGRLIVSDSDNKRIAVFDKDGKFLENWAFPSRGGSFITADDVLYVSDVNDGVINILKDGKLVESIKVPGRPHWVTLDKDGTIYATDSMNRVVMKITKK